VNNRELRIVSIAVLVAAAVTWAAATSDYSPIKPQQDRPVLRFLARLAKTGLWVMMFAEPAPADSQQYVVHARVDSEGHRVLNHGQGW
jgi:hypothetical protein